MARLTAVGPSANPFQEEWSRVTWALAKRRATPTQSVPARVRPSTIGAFARYGLFRCLGERLFESGYGKVEFEFEAGVVFVLDDREDLS